jgi:hypothetical protein
MDVGSDFHEVVLTFLMLLIFRCRHLVEITSYFFDGLILNKLFFSKVIIIINNIGKINFMKFYQLIVR